MWVLRVPCSVGNHPTPHTGGETRVILLRPLPAHVNTGHAEGQPGVRGVDIVPIFFIGQLESSVHTPSP